MDKNNGTVISLYNWTQVDFRRLVCMTAATFRMPKFKFGLAQRPHYNHILTRTEIAFTDFKVDTLDSTKTTIYLWTIHLTIATFSIWVMCQRLCMTNILTMHFVQGSNRNWGFATKVTKDEFLSLIVRIGQITKCYSLSIIIIKYCHWPLYHFQTKCVYQIPTNTKRQTG